MNGLSPLVDGRSPSAGSTDAVDRLPVASEPHGQANCDGLREELDAVRFRRLLEDAWVDLGVAWPLAWG